MDGEHDTRVSHLGEAILVGCNTFICDAGPAAEAIDVASEIAAAVRQVALARRGLARQRQCLLKSRSLGLCTRDQELTVEVFASMLASLESYARQLEEAAKHFVLRPLLS